LQEVQRGDSLSFGTLTLDMRGLHCGEQTIAAQDIGGARIDWAQKGGLLKVRRRGRWLALPEVNVGDTPNLTVLVGILQKTGTSQIKPPEPGAARSVLESDLTEHPHYAPVLQALHEASQAAQGTFVTLVSESYVVQFLNVGDGALMLDVPLMHWKPVERDRGIEFFADLPSSSSQGLGTDTLNADYGGSPQELEQAARAAMALFLDVLMLDRDFELQVEPGS
jgi:hypothetical protein